MRSMTIADPKLRAAVDDYAEAIIGISIRERQISDIDKEVLGAEGPPDPARYRIVARSQRAARSRALPRFRQDAGGSQVAEHRARHRRRADRAFRRAVGGSPHRASAGIDRNLDPCGGRRRDRTPRSRRPMWTTRSAISPAPPKYSARRWSMPMPRARRRCARSPNSGSPRKAIASCSKSSVDGIYVTTPGGALLNANPALARMMGYATPQDLINGIGDIADTVYVDPRGAGGIRAADAARRHGPRVRIPGSRARRRGALAVRQRQRRAQRGRRDRPLRRNGARHHRPEARRGCDRRRPPLAANGDRHRARGHQRQGQGASLCPDEPLHGRHFRHRAGGCDRPHHVRSDVALRRAKRPTRTTSGCWRPARSSASTRRNTRMRPATCGNGWSTSCRSWMPPARSRTSSPSRSTSASASASNSRCARPRMPPKRRCAICGRRRTR